MPSIAEEIERLKWLLANDKVTKQDRCKLIIPKVDVHERIRNEKKIKRIMVNTDSDGVSEFAALKEAAIRELEENPSLFVAWLLDAMRNYSPKRWLETMAANKEEGVIDDWMIGRVDEEAS